MTNRLQAAQCILFDLDGTLTDPGVGITRSVAYALRDFGIETEDLDTLCGFIGPPLKASFTHFYGMNEADAERAVAKYREYFQRQGMFENTVYPGVPELLEQLQSAGKQLMVATSKPTVFARAILDHFGMAAYFSGVTGSELDGTRTDKGEVIACALASGGFRPELAVMVGDRSYDVIGAAQNGLPSVGVLYGYGSREELEQAGASVTAMTVEELQMLLL